MTITTIALFLRGKSLRRVANGATLETHEASIEGPTRSDDRRESDGRIVRSDPLARVRGSEESRRVPARPRARVEEGHDEVKRPVTLARRPGETFTTNRKRRRRTHAFYHEEDEEERRREDAR